MTKTFLTIMLLSTGLSAQVTDNGSGPIPSSGRVCLEETSGRTCWTIPPNTSVSLDSYVKLGDITPGARNTQIGQLTGGGNSVKFVSRAQAIFWQIVNRLAPTWLQAQAKASITDAAQELATQQNTAK